MIWSERRSNISGGFQAGSVDSLAMVPKASPGCTVTIHDASPMVEADLLRLGWRRTTGRFDGINYTIWEKSTPKTISGGLW